jgi:hypothetical protein
MEWEDCGALPTNPGTTLAWRSRDRDGPRPCRAPGLPNCSGSFGARGLGAIQTSVYKKTHSFSKTRWSFFDLSSLLSDKEFYKLDQLLQSNQPLLILLRSSYLNWTLSYQSYSSLTQPLKDKIPSYRGTLPASTPTPISKKSSYLLTNQPSKPSLLIQDTTTQSVSTTSKFLIPVKTL